MTNVARVRRGAGWVGRGLSASDRAEYDRNMLDSQSRQIQELRKQQDALVAALRSIAANSCCDKCQEAAQVARAVLAAVDKDQS